MEPCWHGLSSAEQKSSSCSQKYPGGQKRGCWGVPSSSGTRGAAPDPTGQGETVGCSTQGRELPSLQLAPPWAQGSALLEADFARTRQPRHPRVQGLSWVYPNSRQLGPEAMSMGMGTAGRRAISPHRWEGRSTGHIPLPGPRGLGMARLCAGYLCSGQGTGRCSWWHQACRTPRSRSCAPCRGRWQRGSSGPQSPPGTGICHRA